MPDDEPAEPPVLHRSTALVPPPVRGENLVASLSPFGVGRDKPRHVLAALRAFWQNRRALPYASRVLSLAVCDACSLGPRGLRDDAVNGTHLCTARLDLIRHDLAPALAPADLLDPGRLRRLGRARLRALGRLSYPYVREQGDRGLRKVDWDTALALIGDAIRDVPGPHE